MDYLGETLCASNHLKGGVPVLNDLSLTQTPKKNSIEIPLDSVLHSFSTAGYLLSDQEVFLVLRVF